MPSRSCDGNSITVPLAQKTRDPAPNKPSRGFLLLAPCGISKGEALRRKGRRGEDPHHFTACANASKKSGQLQMPQALMLSSPTISCRVRPLRRPICMEEPLEKAVPL